MARKFSVQKIALTGVMAAVGFLFLLLAGIAPTGWIGITALAGFPVALCVSVAGYFSGIMCWIVAGLMALLLVPGKQVAVLFLCLFGIYPILKNRIERTKSFLFATLIKLLCYNVIFFALYFMAYPLMFQSVSSQWKWNVPLLPALWIITNIIFLAYDCAFSKIMALLQMRLVPEMRQRWKGR